MPILSTIDLLDALEGIAYIVDAAGIIEAYGHRNWQKFADDNGGGVLTDPRLIVGRPILDFVTGDDVRESYTRYMDAILSQQVEAVSFIYHCDAPDVSRELRMAMTPVPGPKGKPCGILYHSVVMSESVRPPLNIFDFQAIREAMKGELARPILALCSYCQLVRYPPGSDQGEWMAAEDYYRKGGKSDVNISHSICPECIKTIVEPALDH